MKKPKGSREQYFSPGQSRIRELRIEANVEEGSRSVELSFSSATPLRQYDWWTGGYYDEILDHSEGAVNLARLKEIGVGLFNHDMNKVIGRLEGVSLDTKKERCVCKLIFDDDDESQKVFDKVKSGTLKGVSVGFRVYKWEEVDADGVSKEGIEGPVAIAREWEPYEISIVSCPADPTVGVGRSFKQLERIDVDVKFREAVMDLFRQYSKKELTKGQLDEQLRALVVGLDAEEAPEGVRFVRDMREASGFRSEDEDDDEAKNEDEEDDESKSEDEEDEEEKKEKKTKNTDEDDERGVKAERVRAAEITSICRKYGVSAEDTAAYIRKGTSVGAVCRKIIAGEATKGGVSVGRSVSIEHDERDKFRAAAVDGMCMRGGAPRSKPAPGADEFRHMSLLSLASECLSRTGSSVTYRDNPMDIAARAFSTSDFPAIMSNLANVVLLEAYQEAQGTWRDWCGIGNATDFKEMHKVRMGEMPTLEPVLEGGEYKMADLVETKDSFSIGTFGKKFALTRQAIINDDLGAFTRIPTLFGSASARTLNRAVYKLLQSNPKIAETGKALFHADHGNLATVAAALGVKSLSDARVSMRRQKGLRKDEEAIALNIAPKFLIVPPELETLARQILYSDTDITSVNPGVLNPLKNAFDIIVEAELTGWAWYLAAAASTVDTIEVAFLNGQQSPTIEQQQGWNVDGLEYKVRLDFGVWNYEYRGLYKNGGAEPTA